MTTEIKVLRARIKECNRDIEGMKRSQAPKSIKIFVSMVEYRDNLYRELEILYAQL